VLTPWLAMSWDAAMAAPSCVAPALVDQTFANGARWQMCWTETLNEGVVLTEVWYTPVNGTEILVLGQVNLAEIHISYDDNSADFFDVSVFGMGGVRLSDLAPEECDGGTLITSGTKDILCQRIDGRGYAYKLDAAQVQGEEMELWYDSQFNHYNFVVRYTFRDDGSIELALGLTGELAKYTPNANHGWEVAAGSLGTNHVHAAWWRIDFDLGGSIDDVVEEIEFTGSGNARRTMVITPYAIETARPFNFATFRFWRVRDDLLVNADGHAISYDILPGSRALFRGTVNEPWTAADIYATEDDPCEMFATHNPVAGGCGSDVSMFVDGETLTDPVVWIVDAFHHVPRDEDEPQMPIHWLETELEPRDLHAENPIP